MIHDVDGEEGMYTSGSTLGSSNGTVGVDDDVQGALTATRCLTACFNMDEVVR